MSRGVNHVILIGNIGRDPEVRSTPAGSMIANMSIATNESWVDKATGERKEKAEFHQLVLFGKLAEIAGQYLKKGSLVYVDGKLQTRKWQAKDGTDRYTTEVVVANLQMLGKKDEGYQEQMARTPYVKPGTSQQAAAVEDFWDDIPL